MEKINSTEKKENQSTSRRKIEGRKREKSSCVVRKNGQRSLVKEFKLGGGKNLCVAGYVAGKTHG